MTRIEKLRKALGSEWQAALVMNDFNRAYLCGVDSSAGVLIITQTKAYLVIDSRFIEVAKRGAEKGIEVILMEKLYDQLSEIAKDEKVSEILIEDETSVGELSKLKKSFKGINKFVCDGRLSEKVASLRAVKDEGELNKIRAAQKITDAAFSYILGFIETGMTERRVAAELEYFMRKNGADGLAFETICVAGKNSSLPHGVPTDNKIKKGDFLTMDFGAKKDGYCSDMTRTVVMGKATKEQEKVYETVLTAHLTAEANARPGMTGKELDKIARDIIYSAGYEGCFGHALGHSLGLEVHEDPRVSPSGFTPLEAGMLATIEPGIYLEGRYGVRIENMIVFTKDGCENLTKSPRELIIL